MKDSYLVKKKADEIIVADMSGGIKKEEIMAFNDRSEEHTSELQSQR